MEILDEMVNIRYRTFDHNPNYDENSSKSRRGQLIPRMVEKKKQIWLNKDSELLAPRGGMSNFWQKFTFVSDKKQ